VPKKEDEIRDHPDGGAGVPMHCEACEGTSEMALVLSPEEAQAGPSARLSLVGRRLGRALRFSGTPSSQHELRRMRYR
jgi:hypothetical protein